MNTTAGEPAAKKPFRPGLFEESPAGRPRLLTSSCATCGRHFFPARADCPHCGDAGKLATAALGGEGTIYASTIVRVPSPAGIKPPYAYGYVNLDAAPLRVFALFESVDPERLRPGSRVAMTLGTLRVDAQGNELITYKFRPVAKEDPR